MAFDGKYLEWNQKRIKGIIDYYGHNFFYYKKVLDLGCGHADISGALHRLGAIITAVDARQEHLKVAAKKFPGIKTVKFDLDRGWPFHGQPFDLILDLDLITHLSNYEAHLKAVCASTSHLVLECAVCDSDDIYKNSNIVEGKNVYDLSVNGIGCRPSAAAIERVLKQYGMSFIRADNSKYNSNGYVYDWKCSNNNDLNQNKRRLWFCTKNNSITINNNNKSNIQHIKNNIAQANISQANLLNPYPIKTKLDNKVTGKKIRTALCISGHLRTFANNFDSVRNNILELMDCDVFIHTWDNLGLSYRPCDSRVYAIQTQNIIDKIKELYKPKKLVVEPNRNFIVTPQMKIRQLDQRDIPGILGMYYKIEACNDLKKKYEIENNFIYDCVIRFRGDLFMEMPFPIDNSTNLNSLFIPMFGNFGGLCDQLAYGSSTIMDVYSSLYSRIPEYMNNGAPMHPEKLLQWHVNVNKLPVTKVNIKFLIKRSNGLVQDNMQLERAWGFLK